MPINLNPGFVYSIGSGMPLGGPRAAPVRPADNPTSSHTTEVSTAKNSLRSDNYVSALRELKAEESYGKRDIASRTYLEIAHYEGNYPLVDVYT